MAKWISVVGGAKSGKTEFILAVCERFDDVVWWGTAVEIPQDPDWQSRIEFLRSKHKSSWTSLDGPSAWPRPSGSEVNLNSGSIFVLDSLNLWLASHMQQAMARYSPLQLRTHLEVEFQHLLKSLRQLPCSVIAVTAEAGCGVVPSGEAGRLFRELIGQWNKELVACSHFGVSLQCGEAFLWPAGLTPVSDAGDPVRRVSKQHVQRVLSQV
jgi:adenosylcobinamide kinase/adenosylcobinamide-phosphate guanylyltransferase